MIKSSSHGNKPYSHDEKPCSDKRAKQAKAVVTKQAGEVRSRHEFVGSHEAAVITEWLNDPKRPPNDEVEQLIGLHVKYEAGGLEVMEVGQEICDFVNRVVRRWKLGTAPVASFDRTYGLTIEQRSKTDMRKVPPMQSLAFVKALELLSGLLTRVRRCKLAGCRKWFFAVFDHAVYHSEECRVRATSSSPEFRERRRKYMQSRRKKQMKGGK